MMDDHLEFLRGFQELCDKYSVRKIDTPSMSPYFSSAWGGGGVSTANLSGATSAPKMTYGYERWAWKDTVNDD